MKKLYSALEQYNLQNKTATLLGHNENMAFNVADLFLLRIHQSAQIFDAEFLYKGLNRKAVYTAEMLFLQHLKNNGLAVQTPVADKNGNLVSCLDDGTLITLLNWTDGKSACENDLSPEFCVQYGRLVAQLHRISRDFESDCMLKYDDRLCDILLSQLDTAYNKGRLCKDHYSILADCCNVIKSSFSQCKSDYVVVHGDLSLSNTLVTETGPALIDFSLFGYGHPMLDAACIYSFMPDASMRNSFDEGYLSCGGSIDRNMLNICCAFNELMGLLLHIDKLATEKWFCGWLDNLCKNVFIPVTNNREPIWSGLNS